MLELYKATLLIKNYLGQKTESRISWDFTVSQALKMHPLNLKDEAIFFQNEVISKPRKDKLQNQNHVNIILNVGAYPKSH